MAIEKQFNSRMQQKIDTTANWGKATNFIPKKGEIIVYSDGGGVGVPKIKVGDGTTKVGSLKFIESDGKLSTGRKISLGTAVTSTATEFDGSKDITIPVNSVSASYLNWGGRSIAGAISPIDAALSYMHSANRLQFAKPDGITIEYSTNSGSTWVDYGASDSQKISLVSGLYANLFLGKHTSGTTATTDALRITLNASNCNVYTIGRTLLINFTTAGASGCKVKIETSTIGAPATFTDRGSYDIDGWSGWNSYPIDIGPFGGNPTQTWQIANIRLTFTIGSAPYSGQRAAVLNLLLFGDATWATPSDMARTGHIYDWDINQNAIFPAGITATSFNGPATSALEISSTDPKLAYANDGNAVQLLSNTQTLLPEISSLARITKALDFQHYNTHWRIGNLRGGSTNSLGFAFSYSADNETYTLPAYIDTNGAYHGKLANSLTLNGTSYNASSAISLSSQQLGVPSAFIAKSVSVLDCNSEKIGRVLSSSAGNTLVNGPAEIGSTGAGVLWNIPALSAPTSSINESGTWQYLHQVFITGTSGRVYLRSCSSNGTAGNWSYGEWAKVLTDKNFSTSIVGKLNIGGTNLLTNTKSFVNGNYTIKGTLQSETYNGFAVRQAINSSDDAALIIQYSPTLEANKSYTLSFWAKGSGSIQALITGYSQPCSSISSEGTTSADEGGTNTFPLTSSWKRYWITFTMGNWSSAASGKVLWLRARTRNDSGRVANVCGLKWENGGVATDWTPAPEDTQHETSSRLVLQSTAWTGSGPYSAVLSCSHITADNTVIVSMAAPVSQVQYETFCKAQITANAQADGSISFTAYGTKPTINLPIAITTLGG